MFSAGDCEEKHLGVDCGVGRQGAGCPGDSRLIDHGCDVELALFIDRKAVDSLAPVSLQSATINSSTSYVAEEEKVWQSKSTRIVIPAGKFRSGRKG